MDAPDTARYTGESVIFHIKLRLEPQKACNSSTFVI